MNFLNFVQKDNKGGDVGMTGMILIVVVLTVMTIGLDVFANMISKEYVIEKMQAAQSYALMSNYDSANSTVDKVKLNHDKYIISAYLNYITQHLKVGNTVFSTLDFKVPHITHSDEKYLIKGKVTYTPHQFIRNPADALFGGVEVRNFRVSTQVQTVLTAYQT